MTAIKKNLNLGSKTMADSKNFDGLYFVPGDEDGQLEISFFTFNDEVNKGSPIENNAVGDKFHVALFKEDDEGDITFDETFEAIFADPVVYLKGLAEMGIYGTFVRKTEKSQKWFDD
jgi:hypothetical protein